MAILKRCTVIWGLLIDDQKRGEGHVSTLSELIEARYNEIGLGYSRHQLTWLSAKGLQLIWSDNRTNMCKIRGYKLLVKINRLVW